MSRLDALERVQVESREQWRQWLQQYHAVSHGIWLVRFKKGMQGGYFPLDEAVEEALCFGWIDSLQRKVDEQRSMLLFTPRKPKSVWSRINKERVARLEAAGLLMPAGIAVIERAKANGSWSSIDAVEAMEMPPDFARALEADPEATRQWESFPASAKKGILQRIALVKNAGTRERRIAEVVEKARVGKRWGFPER